MKLVREFSYLGSIVDLFPMSPERATRGTKRERQLTVLQRNAATGVEVGRLARTIGKALAIGAIAVTAVFAVNSGDESQGLSPAQLEAGNALNVADIGRPQTSVAGGGAALIVEDRADVLFKQKGAGLADPADRIHKQKAAESSN